MKKIFSFLRSNVWYTYAPFLVFIIAFSMRIYGLWSGDLYFDEAATWYISKFTGFFDILAGRYTLEGSPPLPYIIFKLYLFVASSEIQLRLISVFLGLVSIYFLYKIYALSKNKNLALFAAFLVAINPAHVLYSREFRFYTMGFAAQTVSLYFYYKSVIGKYSTKDLIIAFIGLAVGVFTTFSSMYLIGIFIVSELWIRVAMRVQRSWLFVKLLVFLCIVFAGWMILYMFSGGGQIALHNYSGLENREILWSVWYSLRGLFYLRHTWGIMPEYFHLDRFMDPLVDISGNLMAMAVSICVTLVLVVIAGRRERIIGFASKIGISLVEMNMLILHALAFFTILLSSVVFSYLFFNVVSPKLLWPMVVSGVWVSAYVYRICFVKVKKLRYSQNWTLFIIGITLIMISGALSIDNSIRPKYSVRPLFDQIYNESKTAQCSYIVVSHEVGVAVLKYYELLMGKNFPLSAKIIPINYTLDSNLEKIRPVIAAIADPANPRCEKLIYFQYYDFWTPAKPVYIEFHSLLTKYYTKSSTTVVDPLNLSLSIYTNKHP
jgi:4-amino-4-deoxy-L-arabinose transferase-like glycosyltransferase